MYCKAAMENQFGTSGRFMMLANDNNDNGSETNVGYKSTSGLEGKTNTNNL